MRECWERPQTAAEGWRLAMSLSVRLSTEVPSRLHHSRPIQSSAAEPALTYAHHRFLHEQQLRLLSLHRCHPTAGYPLDPVTKQQQFAEWSCSCSSFAPSSLEFLSPDFDGFPSFLAFAEWSCAKAGLFVQQHCAWLLGNASLCC